MAPVICSLALPPSELLHWQRLHFPQARRSYVTFNGDGATDLPPSSFFRRLVVSSLFGWLVRPFQWIPNELRRRSSTKPFDWLAESLPSLLRYTCQQHNLLLLLAVAYIQRRRQKQRQQRHRARPN